MNKIKLNITAVLFLLALFTTTSCTEMAKNIISEDINSNFSNFDIDKDNALNKNEYTELSRFIAKKYKTTIDDKKIEEGFLKNDANKDNLLTLEEINSAIKNFKK